MEEILPNIDSSKSNRALPVLDQLIQFSLFTFVAFSMFSISVTQIAFAIGALSWLYKVHLTQTWKDLKGTLVGVAILCFCLACILSAITSIAPEYSIKLFKKLLQFVIFFWVVNTVRDETQRGLLIGLIIIAGVFTALNGLIPFLEQDHFSPQRLYGTMSTPSTFSGGLMLVGLIALAKSLFYKSKSPWTLGGTGIIGLCLLLSLTRQAWLGFFIGSVFLIFFWNKKYLLLIPLLIAGLLLLGPDGIKDRLHSYTNLKDGALQQRVSTWRGGWEIFKDHPVTGCSFKCVDSIYSQYPDPLNYIAHFRGMHSNLFQLLVDTGVVGLGTWLSIWAAYFIEIYRRWRTLTRENSQDNAEILMGSSAAVLAFLVGGFFETNIYDSEIAMLVYFLMGISLAKVKKQTL